MRLATIGLLSLAACAMRPDGYWTGNLNTIAGDSVSNDPNNQYQPGDSWVFDVDMKLVDQGDHHFHGAGTAVLSAILSDTVGVNQDMIDAVDPVDFAFDADVQVRESAQIFDWTMGDGCTYSGTLDLTRDKLTGPLDSNGGCGFMDSAQASLGYDYERN